jgi:hypothetical protein
VDAFGAPAVRISPFGLRQGIILERHAETEPKACEPDARPRRESGTFETGSAPQEIRCEARRS